MNAAFLLAFLATAFAGQGESSATKPSSAPTWDNLDSYNVLWSSPSRDASGSMPIGNGVVGLNVWVEASGDLLFYISRVDAWSECERLLKLGRVRVALSPNPFAEGRPFRQELELREGRIAITAGEPPVELSIFVDANAPVIYVSIDGTEPRKISATLENWRSERRVLTDRGELQSSWAMRDAPEDILQAQAWEAADVFDDDASAIVWHHRNEHSIVPFTLRRQGLTEIADRFPDPLMHRTFGGRIDSAQLRRAAPATLAAENVTRAEIRITTSSEQTETLAAWRSHLNDAAANAGPLKAAQDSTARWWRAFWDRSWIFIDGDSPGPANDAPPASFRVTRAYVLQRWMTACASRGAFPPKFNGSIFTVEPRFTEGQPFNADWRKWGGSYWWQNTRLPYYPMLAAGDFDLMQPLFTYYDSALPGCKARTKLYYGADGVYFPETMTTFATYANGDYGWKRDGLAPGDISPCPWWQWAWNQSLELAQLMLDYAAYTGDEKFLRERALPLAREALSYFDTRFQRDAAGKLAISPAQAVETYWHDVVNDAPTVAGLHAVCDSLLALPTEIGTPEDRALWKRIRECAPPLPMWERNGKRAAAPAERFKDQRSNCETPELYPLFPFRLYGLGKPNLDLARNAYAARVDKSLVGWTQDGIFAALLGLTDEARENVVQRAGNSHAHFRFPAMWGPNFDWLPDQDHGANLQTALQSMLMQCDAVSGEIRLLPAWPAAWSAHFRLHAPRKTVVEGRVEKGRIVELKVDPPERQRDVVIESH